MCVEEIITPHQVEAYSEHLPKIESNSKGKAGPKHYTCILLQWEGAATNWHDNMVDQIHVKPEKA